MASRFVLGVVGLMALVIVLACGGAVTPTSSAPSGSSQSQADPGQTPPDPGQTNAPSAKVYKTGDSLSVGYTSYRVEKVWWQDYLSTNAILNEPPNASYLFVQLTVRNDDSKARMVPPLKLIDENGAEHEASPQGWRVKGSIGILESLNPTVTKTGFIVFDVPPAHKYQMLVSGGYWSTADALIELVDEQSLERERRQKAAAAEAERKAAEKAEFERRLPLIEKAKWRTWRTSDGKHSIEAKFLKATPDVVTIEKADGKTVDVPRVKLSADDLEFIKRRPWVDAGK